MPDGTRRIAGEVRYRAGARAARRPPRSPLLHVERRCRRTFAVRDCQRRSNVDPLLTGQFSTRRHETTAAARQRRRSGPANQPRRCVDSCVTKAARTSVHSTGRPGPPLEGRRRRVDGRCKRKRDPHPIKRTSGRVLLRLRSPHSGRTPIGCRPHSPWTSSWARDPRTRRTGAVRSRFRAKNVDPRHARSTGQSLTSGA